MRFFNTTLLFFALLIACGKKNHATRTGTDNTVASYTEHLDGDFSFINQWDYPEGIYIGKNGKPLCDGICPEKSYQLLDSSGNIISGKEDEYYMLVDTIHRHHTISCEARCYEWDGTDFITVREIAPKTYECETEATISTHCTLHIRITGNQCRPEIILNSIVSGPPRIFPASSGKITIDKSYLDRRRFRAEFDFTFANPDNPAEPFYWKGKIYAPLRR